MHLLCPQTPGELPGSGVPCNRRYGQLYSLIKRFVCPSHWSPIWVSISAQPLWSMVAMCISVMLFPEDRGRERAAGCPSGCLCSLNASWSLTVKINYTLFNVKNAASRGWFRSIDLWVMGPARFRCATLLWMEESLWLLLEPREATWQEEPTRWLWAADPKPDSNSSSMCHWATKTQVQLSAKSHLLEITLQAPRAHAYSTTPSHCLSGYTIRDH